MKKIITSIGMLVFVGALVVGATGAFFSDTETSTGNVFTAGSLDLKVDSESHYNGMVCTGNPGVWTAGPEFGNEDENVPADNYPQPGDACGGTWGETDLGGVLHKFFNFNDVKPGDEGENTISLHVTDNDAWGCFLVDNVVDEDVDCTEPETESTDPQCSAEVPTPGEGELGSVLTFDAWLDDGSTPGFQCNDTSEEEPEGASCEADPTEGDNIFQAETEGPLFWDDETVDEAAEGPFDIKEVLAAAYALSACTVATGDTDYGACHGLAADGRMVGSATYYFGLAWNVPEAAGNEVQTDQLTMDMIFEIAQHRNNPNFTCAPAELPEPILSLVKQVNQDGVEPVSDNAWTLSAVGANDSVIGTDNDPNPSPLITNISVEAGNYTLTESGEVPGFTFQGIACTDGTLVGNVLTLANGDNAVCTFTNVENQ